MKFPNKCYTREMAQARYGHIDFASKYWPNQEQWIKLFAIPEGWFPHWKVLETNQVVKVIACNIDLHIPLRAALNEVKFHGLGQELHTFDGCFVIRSVRESKNMSTHAYGLGLDLNAGTNKLGQVGTDFSQAFIDCFKKFGFDWGGDFTGRKDNMHFSYAWEGHE